MYHQIKTNVMSSINAQCGIYGNLLLLFFGKYSVKVTFLLEKLLDEYCQRAVSALIVFPTLFHKDIFLSFSVHQNYKCNHDAYFQPSLKVIQEEEKECVPYNIKVAEDDAFVPINEMIEKTCENNMMESFRENVKSVLEDGEERLKF